MGETKLLDDTDLHCINKALEDGCDVRIQRIKGGCRIVSERTKVLKRKTEDETEREEN